MLTLRWEDMQKTTSGREIRMVRVPVLTAIGIFFAKRISPSNSAGPSKSDPDERLTLTPA
jgi:hypothetical protein